MEVTSWEERSISSEESEAEFSDDDEEDTSSSEREESDTDQLTGLGYGEYESSDEEDSQYIGKDENVGSRVGV